MSHLTIEQVLQRAERAKSDSDYTYFFALLFAGEALAKTTVLAIVSSIVDDKDRNRYRLEHQLVRADGLGDWGRVLEDALAGPASQYLASEAREEQRELMQLCKVGEWQYDANVAIKAALKELAIESEELPVKSDLKRWFRLFTTLRNKTRAHGATLPESAAKASTHIAASIDLIYRNFRLFKRSWAHLYRNMSGKYRVSAISGEASDFSDFKSRQDLLVPNGVYVFIGAPRRIALMSSTPELQDFYILNGGLTGKKFEMLSYFSDDKIDGDASGYTTPPGALPPSETQGLGELQPKGNCFSNAPDVLREYVARPELESELLGLLVDDKRPVVTLLGRGGIGKTSLALQVLQRVYQEKRFELVVWLSARDVDLQLTGPKPVRASTLSPDEMSAYYSELVLPPETRAAKDFRPRAYFENQLQKCDLGACLFIFDNFETTQNPVEVFNWIDSFIRLPNKALITTRLREFKGDYPVEIKGMTEAEARSLIHQTTTYLNVSQLIDEKYIDELLSRSEGHPYIIKILLGEVAKQRKAANIPQLVANSDGILTALFERTYGSLSPCAQRAFLTLSAWSSTVPRVALEAVLFQSTGERHEVEKGVESLLQYSMAEAHVAPNDCQEFIGLPLVASIFGKKKLIISSSKAAIHADVEILQMLGTSRRDDIHLGLALRIERFLSGISRRIESGASYEDFSPILEAICRAYHSGWLLLARWRMEERTNSGYQAAKEALRRFLEEAPPASEAAEAWKLLGHACYQTDDGLGEVHAFVERAQLIAIPFYDLSNTANRLNTLIRESGPMLDIEGKRHLVATLSALLRARLSEADGNDLSRMAWLAIHSGQESLAVEYVALGLKMDSGNYHLLKLSQRLHMT